jgi:hypothetical protein
MPQVSYNVLVQSIPLLFLFSDNTHDAPDIGCNKFNRQTGKIKSLPPN